MGEFDSYAERKLYPSSLLRFDARKRNSDAVTDLKEMKDKRRVCRAAKSRLRLFV